MASSAGGGAVSPGCPPSPPSVYTAGRQGGIKVNINNILILVQVRLREDTVNLVENTANL